MSAQDTCAKISAFFGGDYPSISFLMGEGYNQDVLVVRTWSKQGDCFHNSLLGESLSYAVAALAITDGWNYVMFLNPFGNDIMISGNPPAAAAEAVARAAENADRARNLSRERREPNHPDHAQNGPPQDR